MKTGVTYRENNVHRTEEAKLAAPNATALVVRDGSHDHDGPRAAFAMNLLGTAIGVGSYHYYHTVVVVATPATPKKDRASGR